MNIALTLTEDLVIWGWGNILVTHDALSFMDDGDEVHIVDEMVLLSMYHLK